VVQLILLDRPFILLCCVERWRDKLGSILEPSSVRGQHSGWPTADDRPHGRLRCPRVGSVHCGTASAQGNVPRKSGTVPLSVRHTGDLNTWWIFNAMSPVGCVFMTSNFFYRVFHSFCLFVANLHFVAHETWFIADVHISGVFVTCFCLRFCKRINIL